MPIKFLYIFLFTFLTITMQAFIGCSANEEPIVWIEHFDDSSQSPKYKIQVDYPRFVYLDNLQIQQKINADIKRIAVEQVQAFVQDIHKSHQADPNLFNTKLSELQVMPMVGYVDFDTASFTLTIIYNNAGSAIATHIEKSFTYNLKTGEQYDFSDLFKAGVNYAAKVADFSAKSIRAQKREEGLLPNAPKIQAATSILRQNFRNFVLYPHQMSIYFYYQTISQQREPDAWVDIPYNELEEYIDKEGPLRFVFEGN